MKTRNIPSFAYITNINAISETNDLGRFFKPTFEFGEDLSLEAVRNAAIQAKSFKQYISRDIMADVEVDNTNHDNTFNSAASFTDSLGSTAGFDSGTDDDIPF